MKARKETVPTAHEETRIILDLSVKEAWALFDVLVGLPASRHPWRYDGQLDIALLDESRG